MATLIESSLTDHSPLDGTNDAINGSEVDENPTTIAQILDGTSQTDLASADRIDFLSAAGHATSREGIRVINLDNAAGAVQVVQRFEWDPGDGGNLTDNSSGIGLEWVMPDSGDNQDVYARLDVMVLDDTATSEDGEFSFKTIVAGTLTEVFTVSSVGPTYLAPAGSPSVLKLQTSELTVVDGDILGRIEFQAPLESSGTDAILVAASIWAEADATFDATTNTTNLVFAAATSETATGVMQMSKTALSPVTTDGVALGTSSLNWSDLFLDSGAVINFDSGDVTLTHSANILTVGGGDLHVANGQGVVIGHSAQITTNNELSELQILGTGNEDTRWSLVRFSDDTTGPRFITGKSASATIAVGSLVAANASCGEWLSVVDDGSDLGSRPASIQMAVDGTAALNDTPGRIMFLTTPSGAQAPTERMRIDSSGNVGIGVSAFGTSATKVLGISADGTVPSTSPAGMIQIFADDSSDGAANATLAIRTEQSVETIGTFTASHKLKIWINGTEYWVQLDAV